jgi:hypothetical protein
MWLGRSAYLPSHNRNLNLTLHTLLCTRGSLLSVTARLQVQQCAKMSQLRCGVLFDVGNVALVQTRDDTIPMVQQLATS